MRKAIIIMTMLAAGCIPPPSTPESEIRERAQLVRNCPGGLLIGRDPVTKRLTWSNGWTNGGVVAADVSIDDVCATMEGR
jgi:hypothetical protein